MTEILGQLARSGLLLPDMSAAILTDNVPPLAEIGLALTVMTMDAESVISGDTRSSLTERRLAKMSLAVAFLAAMAILSPPSNLTRS